MRTRLLDFSLAFCLLLLSKSLFALVPIISYTAPAPYTVGTAIPALSPANTGGAVASLAFGTPVSLTGATLNNPYGMGIDPSGNIYVVNYGNNTVSEYNSTGTYKGTFGTGGTISNPAGITFDASGNAYLLNYNRTNNGNGNSNGNAYVDEYGSSGVFAANIVQGLGTSNGIAIDALSNLYTAEGSNNGGNNTVSQFSTSGGLAFSTTTNTANPVAVAVDGSGNIYALDNTNKNIVKFNSNGTFVSIFASGFTNPNAICIDGAGDIYVGDSGTGGTTGSVKVYNSTGTLLTSVTGLTDPRGLVTDSKGNLYVSDYTNGTVKKYPIVGGYVLSGTLPAGLSFSSTTGAFSGTPTTPFNSTTYTIIAYNASGSGSTTVTLSCPPTAGLPIFSYNPSINVFTINAAITALSPTNTGGTPGSYSISPAALPTGLSFSASTGVISGTPTATSAATLYTITATNASGSATTTISIACVIYDYWTGAANGANSSDWNTKKNWSVGVPGPTDLASIGVIGYPGGNQPIISAADGAVNVSYVTFGSTTATTLTVQTGASLTVKSLLTVNTNASPILTGTGTGAINIAPAAVVNISGTGGFNHRFAANVYATI